jgi:hypothetical protein
MTKVVVDAALRDKLTAPAELTDEAGHTVGFVISPQQFERIQQLEEDRKTLYEWANSLVTDEELDASEAEGGEFTPEDIKEMFRKLEALDQAKSARPIDSASGPGPSGRWPRSGSGRRTATP